MAATGGGPGGPTAAQGRWMGLRIGFMQRRRSSTTTDTPKSPREQLIAPTEQPMSMGTAGVSAEQALAGAHDNSAAVDERAEENKRTVGDVSHEVSVADAEQTEREASIKGEQ